jgi:hypothetical protein
MEVFIRPFLQEVKVAKKIMIFLRLKLGELISLLLRGAEAQYLACIIRSYI